jgi:putative oxidoreductase
MIRVPKRTADITWAILRVGAGLLFMAHGAQKLLGWFGGMGGEGGTAPLFSQIGLAGVLEVVGGALIVLGLFTRPTAIILVAEMVVAYFQVHAPRGLWPIQNQGELALLYGLIFLFLATNGAGPFSIDSSRQRNRTEKKQVELDDAEIDGREHGTPGVRLPSRARPGVSER